LPFELGEAWLEGTVDTPPVQADAAVIFALALGCVRVSIPAQQT
jgi:hypothetical protein